MQKLIVSLLLLTACSTQPPALEPERTPAGLGAEFEALERDAKWETLMDTLDLEDPNLQWEYKSGGTSVGFKVKKDGQTLVKFMPKNAAANPETQVVSYYLGRFLHMGEMVIPAAYFELRPKAIAHFAQLLRKASEKNKWRKENRDNTLASIAKNPNSLSGIVVPNWADNQEAQGVANAAANTINSSHPIAQFIRANGPMPSPAKPMSLKGVKMRDGKIPVASELELASQFSQIMVLDILCGQWDRWSGGNVEASYSKDTGRLYFFARDNGGASMVGTSNLQKYFGIVSRFDRGQIQRVQRLIEILKGPNAPALVSSLGMRSDPKSLLARATAVVERVNQLVSQHGEAKVFFAQQSMQTSAN